MRSTEWAGLVDIPGDGDFFTAFNRKVRSCGDLKLLVNYLIAHARLAFGVQETWLMEQIDVLRAQVTDGSDGSPECETRDEALEEESSLEQGNTDSLVVHPLRTAIRMAIEELAQLHGMPEKLVQAFGTTRTLEGEVPLDEVVDRLLFGTQQPDPGFPLQRFRSALKKWARNAEPIPGADRKHFVYLKDLLMVASFPSNDHQRVEEAMRSVLATTPMGGAPIYAGTCRRDAVEKLLRATMARLMPGDFPDSAIPKLLYSCGSAVADMDRRLSLMFQRLKVIPDPDVKPADRSTEDYYAEMGVIALSKEPMKVANWVVQFNYILDQHHNDQEVVAMFISKDRETAIEVLQTSFPRLLLVPLPERDLERYSQIYYEVGEVNEALEVLCGSQP